MVKIKYLLASAILCLTLLMSAFADDAVGGNTGIGSFTDNPSASGTENQATTISSNPVQDVINSLMNYFG
jgi:hypothetical protein